MKALDRLLQRWRIDCARRRIRRGARVLDVGSADSGLSRRWGGSIASGIGIEPTLGAPIDADP